MKPVAAAIVAGMLLGAIAGCARAQEDGYPIPLPPFPTEPAARPYLGWPLDRLVEELGAPSLQVGDDLVRELTYRADGCQLYFLLTNDDGAGLVTFQAAGQTSTGDSFPFAECLRRWRSRPR